MSPSGEQHERAIEAAAQIAHEAWCDNHAACTGLYDDDHAQADAVINAYLASLTEQGVVLVDLSEVVEFLREQGEEDEHGYRDHFDPDDLADAIERRFAPERRSEAS